MNTRIQVEHTISEMITGIDLIKQQIKIAEGMKLSYRQEDIKCLGHAMECRINAENIKMNFAPSPGKISFINFLVEEMCVLTQLYIVAMRFHHIMIL